MIGMASWRLGTMVGLRPADPSAGPAIVVTKAFNVSSDRLGVLINVDARSTACGNGSVVVELLDEAERPLPQASGAMAIPISRQSTAARVRWRMQSQTASSVPTVQVARGAPMRVRFTIAGTARLYAFRLLRA